MVCSILYCSYCCSIRFNTVSSTNPKANVLLQFGRIPAGRGKSYLFTETNFGLSIRCETRSLEGQRRVLTRCKSVILTQCGADKIICTRLPQSFFRWVLASLCPSVSPLSSKRLRSPVRVPFCLGIKILSIGWSVRPWICQSAPMLTLRI